MWLVSLTHNYSLLQNGVCILPSLLTNIKDRVYSNKHQYTKYKSQVYDMRYVRRTGFTYELNNPDGTPRPRRGLFWMKKIYKEWFEWAKMSGEYPSEFGNLDDFDDFEVWWKHPDYGFELFCEPEQGEPLKEVKEIEEGKHIKHLRINLTGDTAKINLDFKRFLDKNIVPTDKIVSQARFQPSKPQRNIKLPPIKKYRETYIQREILGMSRGDVLEERMGNKPPHLTKEDWKLAIISGRQNSERMRTISREVQKAKIIIKNIKKGTFP